jgi:single-strand selective monofunctional uracil DNA glycosylase
MRDEDDTATSIIELTRSFAERLNGFEPPRSVSHVYNTLDYALDPQLHYLRRFAAAPKRVVFLGMNPGPWGMAQTGVPFGEIHAVRDWMGIEGTVGQPPELHPKRPIHGFACTRSEASGKRLWGLMQARFGSAEAFFREHFVLNYCPLLFITPEGKNLTPDKLPRATREALFAECDAYLAGVLRLLKPSALIGVGTFALERLQAVSGDGRQDSQEGGQPRYTGAETVGSVLHPSPANPKANRGWAELAARELVRLGVWTE